MSRQNLDFLQILRKFFDSDANLTSGKKICVCLSGGADSVALLRGMLMIAGEYGFSVCAAHFNHMIRGEESDRDEQFCIKLCDALGVTLFRGRDDVPAYAKTYKKSLEEAARDCRYAFFERMAKQNRFDYYATAHNKNDDAETLLMNLIRGSGSNGASSLAHRKDMLIRPILGAGRDVIEDFLKQLGQDCVHDSTNDDINYTRNYIRHVVLPSLAKLNPNVIDSLAGFAESSRCDRDYFEGLIDNYYDADLRTLPKALADRIILRKYKAFSGKILNSEQLSQLSNALYGGKRTLLTVNSEHEAIIENGKIRFLLSGEIINDYPEQLLNEGENSVFGGNVRIYLSKNDNCTEKFYNLSTKQTLSFDNISGRVRVRQRREGDKVKVFGINKSVKKLFIDKKIPKELRNIIPVFFDDEGILYIPFVCVADRAFPKKDADKLSVITIFDSIEKERWSQAYEK